ncbi:MAG TPA: cell surface protein SprA [Gemmatimonadaceae bacterium]
MRSSRPLLLFAFIFAWPVAAAGQNVPGDTLADTSRAIGVRPHHPTRADTLALPLPAPLLPFGRLAPSRVPAAIVAETRAAALRRTIVARRAAIWGETVSAALAGAGAGAGVAAAPSDATVVPGPPTPPGKPAPPAQRTGTDIFGQYANLGLQLQSRVEVKGERDRNERCVATDFLTPISGCRGTFQPQFDFQFGVRTGGVVADRVHVNVDYDSQREFDASNNISVYYEGKPDEILHRLEVGNVSFVPPPSRFITAGIPSGNYGIQAIGQLGPMNFRAIAAQQKGNVIRDRVFTVGDRTMQTVDREIEDYQLERRRFFWVVDPKKLSPSYPNIDVLDPGLPALAARLPLSERPRRVLVYRYRSPAAGGSTARDINGPYAVTRYARNTNVIGPYEVLQQGVDYYIDPTNLWIVLVSPLSRDERLAVSYTVTGPDGRERVGGVGGTFPQRRGVAGRDTVNLLWDNEVLPGDSAFDREIRSAYRLGGEDLQRQSVTLKIVVGSGADQEKPVGGAVDTYLQLFGLAQRNNSSTFDVENRLWPRVGDPNQALTTSGGLGGASSKLIRDHFVIFPSLMPFADSGLVHPPNPVNDSLYRTTDEDLISPRRPPTQFRIRARYSAEGGGESGSLMLGSVQVRQGSERLFLEGRQLVRDVDYTVDYELGRVTFIRPDTLFARPRQVSVQFEENPLFAAAPTSILGLAAEFPTEHGQFNITALSQSQRTSFNRPPLGFEPQSALLAGVSGNFTWESTLLTRLLDKLPLVDATTPSTVSVQGEFATSRPQNNAAGSAYVETFEGEGGVTVSLQESAWRTGSQPAVQGAGVRIGSTTYDFPLDSATTLAWQNLGTVLDPVTQTGSTVQFFPEQIDSQFVFIGGQTFRAPETVLWLDLFPPNVGGLRDPAGRTRWLLPPGGGRPWRSISQSLNPTGVDLSHVEQLEFWALIDTSEVARRKNPALVLDFGEVSENSIAFAPETLTVHAPTSGGGGDSVYTGRQLVGFDRLDTERDPVTQSFDVARNDTGIPGDVADTIVVHDALRGVTSTATRPALCHRGPEPVLPLGDERADCSVGNRRLDEEDLDRDGFLNLKGDARNAEQLLRYVVDLGDASSYTKTGRCYRSMTDTSSSTAGPRNVCWVKFQLPFASPTAALNAPLVRRIKSVRVTMVGGAGRQAGDFTRVALARLRLTGSPWTKRTDQAIAGIGGTRVDGPGTVIATTIGTQDRDARLAYESPPGVTDEPDSKGSVYSPGTIQVNEKSLRVLAVDVPLYHRAEAFYRFPEGEKNFMGYRELRVWARGRGKGWGVSGDLQFFVKVGRDADNFYLYRTPVNQGPGRDAWLPEVQVDFRRFYALRARLENAYLHGGTEIACTGLDSALIASSGLPTAPGTRRFAACDGGYIVYTSNPEVSPPNLAAVQELAVGMVRVSTAGLGNGGAISPADSLELWVDDIRLTSVVNDPGYAGQIGLSVAAGDVGSLQVSASRRDQNFRQLGEQPTFITDDQLALSSSVRLDKFLPQSLGLVLPLTVTHTRTGGDPLFLSNSDVTAAAVGDVRTPRASATSWALTARRATPLEHGALAPILNNLALTTTYVSASSRSEFQTGSTSAFSSGLDYDLVSQARTTPTPAWLRRAIDWLPDWLGHSELLQSLRNSTIRWNPTLVRFTSTYARNSDTRESFSLPEVVSTDSARRVRGLEDVWRNTAAIELRPFNALSARFDVSSLRDLRDYGDSTGVGVVASGERRRFLGMDVGMERERQMSAVVSAVLPLTAWVKPRVDFNTTFSLLRDPNARNLLQTGDTTGDFRLPRRLANGQGLAVTATFDIPRAIALYTSESSALRGLAKAISPIDVQWRRDLRSTFDGVAFDPSLGYQLALGGVDRFREVNGVPATSAGVSRNLVVSHSLFLPLGLTVMDRYSRTRSTSWSRILDIQTLLEAEQRIFPDVSVRWNFTPPEFLRPVLTSVGAQVGARVTKSSSFQPTAGDQTFIPGLGLRIEQTLHEYPLNGSVTWALLGGFSTSAGWNRTDRREIRSGGLTEGSQHDLTIDVGKAFPLPRRWTLKSHELRTRVGYQSTHTQAFFVQDSTRKRVTDNGRWAITGNADSDVSDTMSLSLLLARVLTYDNALDRRFSQTVVSVVFHLQFFAGDGH